MNKFIVAIAMMFTVLTSNAQSLEPLVSVEVEETIIVNANSNEVKENVVSAVDGVIPEATLNLENHAQVDIEQEQANILSQEVFDDFEIVPGTVASEKMDLIDKMIEMGYFFIEQRVTLKNDFINKEDNEKIVTGLVLPPESGQEQLKNSMGAKDVATESESSNQLYSWLFLIGGLLVLLPLLIFFKNKVMDIFGMLMVVFNKMLLLIIVQVGLISALIYYSTLIENPLSSLDKVIVYFALPLLMLGIYFMHNAKYAILYKDSKDTIKTSVLLNLGLGCLITLFAVCGPMLIAVFYDYTFLYIISTLIILWHLMSWLEENLSILKNRFSMSTVMMSIGLILWFIIIGLSFSDLSRFNSLLIGVSIAVTFTVGVAMFFRSVELQNMFLSIALILFGLAFIGNEQLKLSAAILVISSVAYLCFILFRESANKLLSIFTIGLVLVGLGLFFKYFLASYLL